MFPFMSNPGECWPKLKSYKQQQNQKTTMFSRRKWLPWLPSGRAAFSALRLKLNNCFQGTKQKDLSSSFSCVQTMSCLLEHSIHKIWGNLPLTLLLDVSIYILLPSSISRDLGYIRLASRSTVMPIIKVHLNILSKSIILWTIWWDKTSKVKLGNHQFRIITDRHSCLPKYILIYLHGLH